MIQLCFRLLTSLFLKIMVISKEENLWLVILCDCINTKKLSLPVLQPSEV